MSRAVALLLLAVSLAACADAARYAPLELSSLLRAQDKASRVVDEKPVRNDQAPGIELAARQYLFNYATQQGLEILKSRIQDLVIPDVAKSFNLPLVGEFTLKLSDIQITQFNASSDEAKLTIMDERFELWVTQVEVQIVFSWHWEKLGMQGTGSGELDLHGGSIDYQFRVNTSDTGKPCIQVDDVSSKFASVDLQIKSFSADWLYQAVMSLFNDQIQKAVQNGIANALQQDVPTALNKVLDTLPTRVDITGLPFSTTFEYSIFTLTYVMVKGYGEVESDTDPSVQRSALEAAAATASEGPAAELATSATAATEPANTDAAGAAAKKEAEKQGQEKAAGGDTAVDSQAAPRLRRSGPIGSRYRVMSPCPFASTPLPLTSDQVAADSHMISIYLHESVANCMLWGLHRGGALQYDLVDGAIPKLHLTTDLLAMLIPGLPKAYPHQLLRITMEALAAPHVQFTAAQGTTIEASYRTSVYVVNETMGNPKIVTLSANLTIVAQVTYDSTIITSAVATHVVEESSMPVSAAQWDNTVAWFIQNYAGLYPLQFLINNFVQTPVTSLVSLVDAAAETYDGWFALSSDVVVHPSGRRRSALGA